MPLHPARFVAASVVFSAQALAAEPGAPSPPRRAPVVRGSAGRTYLREQLTAAFPPPSSAKPAPVAKDTSPILAVAVASDTGAGVTPFDGVTMKPFLVFEKTRTIGKPELDAAVAKQHEFESHAAYHKDLTKNVRFEVLLPPGAGSHGGLELPVFRLSW